MSRHQTDGQTALWGSQGETQPRVVGGSATMSPCTAHGVGCGEHGDDHPRLYRYELTRFWHEGGPLLEWILLNPSKATAAINDPTVGRCVGFAKLWGYSGIVIRNLYAWRATDPRELLTVDDPIGPLNFDYLARTDADLTIVGWGAHPAAERWCNAWWNDDSRTIINRPAALYCLGVNAGGSPKHPLIRSRRPKTHQMAMGDNVKTPLARTVVYRTPDNDAKPNGFRFDVDGEPFPWLISKPGPQFAKHGGGYLVTVGILPVGILPGHPLDIRDLLDITLSVRRPPRIGDREFPWAIVKDSVSVTLAGLVPALNLTFIAEHVDTDTYIARDTDIARQA